MTSSELLKFAEQDLSSEQQDKAALFQLRTWPWAYGIETHISGVRFTAGFYARKLVWC